MPTPAITAAVLQDLMRQVTAEMPGAPTQPLRIGEVLAGRVTMDPSGSGERMLMIAGVKIPAQLPADVPIGVALKLQVTETSGDKLVLQVLKGSDAVDSTSSNAPAQQPQTPMDAEAASMGATPWGALPMPGGAQARLFLDPDLGKDGQNAGGASGRDRSRSMVVRYDSPTLGRVDVVLRLETEKLEATVLAPAGEPVARVRAASGELRAALMAAADRPVSLQTGGRTAEVVNVSA
jgi:hypothetical protein